MPIDNTSIERQVKTWAMGGKAWRFNGSDMGGQRAAIVMRLVQSARLTGRDRWAHVRDVLERHPSHPNGRIEGLLAETCGLIIGRPASERLDAFTAPSAASRSMPICGNGFDHARPPTPSC